MKFVRSALVAAGALVAIAAAACAWFFHTAYGDRSLPRSDVRVLIGRGSTFAEVARQLAHEGVIGNVLAFRLLAHARGEETAVRAGEYRFAAHQTQSDILRALVTGGAQIAVWVTIPEGFTVREIAERLDSSGVGPADEFQRAFLHDSISVDGVRTRGLEGFLYPSTYLFPIGASAQQIEGVLTAEFFAKLPAGAAADVRRLRASLEQVVVVASMVEREAKSDSDRPLIASVIYNRLRTGMPLEVDATIEYALPEHKSRLTFADLRIDSPYNSYRHTGLPPTPIANPGTPSLEAALRPANTGFLYYVYCGKGRHVFANTLAEHQANVARCLQ
ncbi:MAG: endolytic transglycosylase MltG [Candidatus Eremiobacteraeota bacterium]|nr:endolytic transglycosylase MltG [Candidatus Eremiobacteraeota bacterium]